LASFGRGGPVNSLVSRHKATPERTVLLTAESKAEHGKLKARFFVSDEHLAWHACSRDRQEYLNRPLI
jgi:hypothetical protein